MCAMENEKLIFDLFLNTCPAFADEPIKERDVVDEWYVNRGLTPPAAPFDRRPDVICTTESGRKIGVELKSWLNEEQIAEARARERIEENILGAIGEQPPNETQHIGFIWLSAKEKRFDAQDAEQFREQIFSLIERVDNDWARKPDWEQNCSDHVNDFAGLPILDKYLQGVRFHPATRSRFDIHWIRFPNRGGAYTPNEMLKPLADSLLALRSDGRYQDLCAKVALDESYLLVHYDFNAFAYNTPIGAPDFGFKEAADFARSVLAGDAGCFDRIFLVHCLQGEEEAYRIA